MTTFSCRRPPADRALRRWLAAALVLAAACDGGTGPSPKPDPQNPVPSISGVDPGTLLQWSDSATVTVTGAGFVNGAVVRLNGTPRLTTYHGPSQLTAVIPAASLQQSGTLQLTVFNPAPGGGESGGTALPVHHRVPAVAEASPGGVMQGSDAFTLTLTGSGFAQASVVRWNGENRPTTFVSQGQLTAQIAAGDVAAAGQASVTVFTPAPGGGQSPARPFAVAVRPNPVPAATAISPGAILAETGTTFTVTGTGFMTGTRVTVGGYAPVVTVTSATELRFSLAPENVPNAGFAQVFLSNPPPGGGASAPLSLRVDNPVPTLSALAPATVVAGADSQVVRLTGTGFVRGSVVRVNGAARTARRTSPTEMELVLRAADLAQAGPLAISVSNGTPGGGVSGALSFVVQNPAPVAQAISPSQAFVGSNSLVVRVTGSGFVAGSVVQFEGGTRPTRHISATELEAVLPAGDLLEAGTFALRVFTPVPGGGTSSAVPLSLATPAPVLQDLSSNGASAGRPGFAMVVNGTGFLRSSVVRWNGEDRPTQHLGGNQLEVTLSSADVASPGTGVVTVHTPGGGTSAAQQITIRAVGPATITSRRILPLPAADVVYDPHSNRLYASMTSEAGERANTVVAIDPATGAVTGSVGVGSNLGRLAVSDDGTTLWVAVDGSSEVRRVSLPDLTPGLSFSLGVDREVEDIRVMPGRPRTVAIALRNTCCSPRHAGVAIFDDGVRRARVPQNHSGNNTIAFGRSAAVLYGYNTESSEAGFRTMQVSDAGVDILRVTERIYLENSMQFAGGRVYSAAPTVVDAERHVSVGSFGSDGAFVTVDATLGRIFYADGYNGRITAYDINTFQELGWFFADGFNSNHPVAGLDRMVRWGTDGLAVSDARQIYIYRTPIAGP
jgi:hypothetical protein